MITLPKMGRRVPRKTVMVTQFGGLHPRPGAGDGTFSAMENMCGDGYPTLSTRQPRTLLGTMTRPNGFLAHGGRYWVDGTMLYDQGMPVGPVADSKKTMVFLGDWLVIFPDKVFYHKVTGEFGSLEATWSGFATFTDGSYAGVPAKANTLESQGEPFPFAVDEAVTITGCTVEENNQTLVIRELSPDRRKLVFAEHSFGEQPVSCSVTVSRKVPDLDFMCENENRLWGCKRNTVFASYLGNPKIWNNFEDLSTACYTVEVGSPGGFTGCASFLGYPVFFQEDRIYKAYGSKPSNFRLMSGSGPGVAKGSHRSLAVAGERLYYLSPMGVMSYAGGLPQLVSEALGEANTLRLEEGVGCWDGRKYVLSAREKGKGSRLLVLDTALGVWHQEDTFSAVAMGYDGVLLLLQDTGKLWQCGGPPGAQEIPGTEREQPFSSLAEWTVLTEQSPDKKIPARLRLEVKVEAGATLTCQVQYEQGEWHTVKTILGAKTATVLLPLLPRRCQSYRLRLQGRGQWRLCGLTREFWEAGAF